MDYIFAVDVPLENTHILILYITSSPPVHPLLLPDFSSEKFSGIPKINSVPFVLCPMPFSVLDAPLM